MDNGFYCRTVILPRLSCRTCWKGCKIILIFRTIIIDCF